MTESEGQHQHSRLAGKVAGPWEYGTWRPAKWASRGLGDPINQVIIVHIENISRYLFDKMKENMKESTL